ncbi:LOW QUALITY PROTEIN: nucleoredoxin-like [Haliotis rubra]|uniref:LOW QUALITY PROTEIN: nucleoredoxin-like n=1 Tax=Haliotis rubra TaxID=36100 RepID=UPI001EE5459A|nr:LOW QUALITY PROTEIN: nucleoredoxin-like [Haliotis rubra]
MSVGNDFAELFGQSVMGKDKSEVPVSSFTGEQKYVGIYFSAHWCPPCRNFTPVLVEFYKKVKSKGLEIVFVSSDRDQESFDDYYDSMPWLTISYADRDRKGQLCEKFGVSGIPSFILLDGNTGAMITKDGRGRVQGDEDGNNFPWQ